MGLPEVSSEVLNPLLALGTGALVGLVLLGILGLLWSNLQPIGDDTRSVTVAT